MITDEDDEIHYVLIEDSGELIQFDNFDEANEYYNEMEGVGMKILGEVIPIHFIDYDESMDGDHASALASAGRGVDEDYE